MLKLICVLISFLCSTVWVSGQSKVNITSKLPSSIGICGASQKIEMDVRNITTGSVSGISVTLTLPSGIYYEKGSVSGTGVTEKSTTNLQKPEFNLPNLTITGNSTFEVKVIADCDLTGFLTSGGIPTITAVCTYTGGSVNHKSLPLSVNQPSINVSSITNQYISASLGELFVRKLTITNGGKGGVKGFTVAQTFESGLKIVSVRGGAITKAGLRYTSSFDTSHIKLVGDKDIYLENGESIEIIDSIIVNGCNSLAESIKLSWGCNNKTCKSLSYNAQVSLKSKAPNLVFKPSATVNTCYDDALPSKAQLMIVNAGDDTARNTKISVFQTANTGFWGGNRSAIDTSSLVMKFGKSGRSLKADITRVRLNLNTGNLACLGSRPLASMDLVLPSILPGDTVYLDWNSISCCTNNCIGGVYAHRWNFSATYEDQCQKTITKAETRGSYGLYHNLKFTSFVPTDIVDKDTAKLIFTVTTGGLVGISANSVLDVYCELPAGIKHSLNKKDIEFRTHSGGTWTPNTVKMVGDSLHAQFKGVPSITLVRSDLVIKLIGDCSSASSNKSQPISLFVNYTPNASCTNSCVFKSLCFTGNIKVHCDNSCASGLKFGDFSMQRISYGLPDNNNDGIADGAGQVDLDKIRTERVMFGDTLLSVFKGKINRQGSITTWTRLTATSTIRYGRYLEVADARVRILRRGRQLYSCDGIKTSSTSVGVNRTFKFDLGVPNLIASKCPLYSGFSYATTDSVELYVKYVVATNPGNFFREIKVESDFYLHNTPNPASYQKYQCDSFSGNFQLVGSYFTNCCRGVYAANSCGEITVTQNYYLSVGNCCNNYHGGNMFPSEYRAWAKPNKLIIIPPTGFDVVHTRLYDYRTAGTGKSKWQYADTIKLSRQLGDTLEYDIGHLYEDKGGSFKISDDGFVGVWYCKLRPNCLAKHGTSIVQYGMEFQQLGFLGNQLERHYTTTHNDQVVYEKPELNLNTLSDLVNADSDTAVWQIVVDNSSAKSNSKNIWIAAANNGNTKIEAVIDIATGKAVKQVNGIFQLGDINAQRSANYLIKATYQSCDRDSFVLSLGNDCDGYPQSLASARCVDLQKTLSYIPQNTLLTPSIVKQDTIIDLCALTDFEIEVKNLSNARAFNLYVDLFLQSGIILKDTAYLFLPGSSDSIRLLNPISLRGGTYRWDVSKYSTYLSAEGLAGVTSTAVNSYKIKCTVSTDCDYVSSTYFLARPGGQLRCGDPVLSNYAASKPIDIKGITKPYFSYIEFDKKPIDICNYDGDGQFRFINLGPDTTGINDYIQLLLPDGIYIDTTFITSVYNGPKKKPTVKKGLKYTGLWEVPSGITVGDSMVFKYRTYVNPAELDCGSTQIIAQSVVLQPALCVKDSTYCDINVSTSNDLQLDSIKKGIYQVLIKKAESIASLSGELIRLNYAVTNSGSKKEMGNLMQVKIVVDSNGNGKLDVGEPIIARDSIWQSINTGQQILDTMQFVVSSQDVCNLLVVIDSTNCVCSQTYQHIGTVHLKNAGRDTTVCSRTNVVVGTAPMPGVTYKWTTANYILEPDSSQTIFAAVNKSSDDSEYRLLLETDRGQCTSTDTAYITLHPAMFLDLEDTIDICAGERVIVGDVPTGGVGFKSYSWLPTDSLQRSTSVKTWANPTNTTNYTITITDSKFCQIKDSTRIVVHQIPTAKLSIEDTCVGVGYTIGHQSVIADIGLDTVQYMLANNDTFVNTTPGFIPTDDNPFEIQLLIRDSFGCTSSDTQFARPYPLPISDFSVQDICQFDSVKATNMSSIKQGLLTYNWQVNARQFADVDLTYSENNFGTFEIELEAVSDKGCTDSHIDTISVYEKPILDLVSTNNCLGDTSWYKTNITSTSGVGINSFDWNFGDGVVLSSTRDTSYIYGSEGKYTTVLTVSSDNGCKDTSRVDVVVHPNPVASFIVSDACYGDSVILNESSSVVTGKLTTRYWNTGAGFLPGSSRKAVLFGTPGVHNIQLISESDSGCVDTSSIHQAQVKYTEKPNLTTYGNCAESEFSFEITPVQPDSMSTVVWDFSSNSISGGIRPDQQIFMTPGTYPVNVTINFNNGCTTDSLFDFAVDPKPVAQFTWLTPCDDNLVRFTSESTTSAGTLTSFDYDFGDGNASTDANSNTLYSALGTYTTELIVLNSFNCYDTVSQDVTVDHIVKPQFDISDICVYDSQLVKQTILDLVTPISRIEWDMGNGQRILGQDSFEYVYQNPGTYKITIQVETNANCMYSATKTIDVHDLPTAGFFMSPERADVVNSEVEFTSNAVDAVSYQYDFSHGFESTEKDFMYRFPDTATYIITQTVTNQYGCKDSFTAEIIIDFVVNILVPSAFHPDNDPINNTFAPQGLGIGRYEMKIYNRWGEQIYTTTESEPWDAENTIPGTYFYLITIYDYQDIPHYFNGTVLLVK